MCKFCGMRRISVSEETEMVAGQFQMCFLLLNQTVVEHPSILNEDTADSFIVPNMFGMQVSTAEIAPCQTPVSCLDYCDMTQNECCKNVLCSHRIGPRNCVAKRIGEDIRVSLQSQGEAGIDVKIR